MTKINNPDSIPALAAEIYGAKNLRTIQGKLLLEQLKRRHGAKAEARYKKLRAVAHRGRARIHFGAKSYFAIGIEQAYAGENSHGVDQLYFKLSNGQLVRSDRILKRSTNPAMRALVAKGIVAQAARA